MRLGIRALGTLCVLWGLIGDCQGQLLPWNIRADSQVRVQYLFGTQIVHPFVKEYIGPYTRPPRYYRIDTEPRFPLIEGELEIITGLPFSARGAFAVNALESKVGSHRSIYGSGTTTTAVSDDWSTKSKFSAWEVAGLYHLWAGGGYRFSVLGGYRYEQWLNSGSKETGADDGSILDEKTASYMPFIGLQTTMSFPLWSSRFEVLGSFFMKRSIDGRWGGDSLLVSYTGYGNTGGFVDLRMSGTVRVSQYTSLGLDGRFSYQEVYGRFDGKDNQYADSVSYDLLLRQTYGTVGIVASLVF